MVNNSKINNFFDRLFNKIIANKTDETSDIESSSIDPRGNILNVKSSFKVLQLSLKIMCLFAFLPYAILGMFYINKSFIFIPCLIMATLTVLLTMFTAVKSQILNEYLQNKIDYLANSFKDFILQNQKNINEIRGIEILENSIKSSSKEGFLDKEFITSSLIKGASKISDSSSKESSKKEFNNHSRNSKTVENSAFKA
jgi:type IV secretory pathway TrbL component